MRARSVLLVAMLTSLAAGCSSATVEDEPDASVPTSCESESVTCARATGDDVSCTSPCGANEVCFTQVSCGPDGTCQLASDERADNECHRTCSTTEDCGAGETCSFVRFFGCTDFNGGAQGRGICERVCD